jgi:hypothetical protein
MELYDDPDPFIGVVDTPAPGYTQNFTIQKEPIATTIKGLQPFTRMRGGAYFFLPGISAVRYLGSI